MEPRALGARPGTAETARMSQKNDDAWAKAKKVCRLNAVTIAKAKALGMAPKSLIKNNPNDQQLWKAPVHIWVEDLYEKRFGQTPPGELAAKTPTAAPPPQIPRLDVTILTELAHALAQELSQLPQVVRVVLFGPLARKDWDPTRQVDAVSMAVWVSSVKDVDSLVQARERALTAAGLGPERARIYFVPPNAGKSLRVKSINHPARASTELRKYGYQADQSQVLFERTESQPSSLQTRNGWPTFSFRPEAEIIPMELINRLMDEES